MSETELLEFMDHANDDRFYISGEIRGTGFVIGKLPPYDQYKWIDYYIGSLADEKEISEYYYKNYRNGNADTFKCFNCGLCSMVRFDSAISIDPITGELILKDFIPKYFESEKYFMMENPTKYANNHILAVSKKHQHGSCIFYDVELLTDLYNLLKKTNSSAIYNGEFGSDVYHHHVHLVKSEIPALRYASEEIDKNPDQAYMTFKWGDNGLRATVIHGDPVTVNIWMSKYYNYIQEKKIASTVMATFSANMRNSGIELMAVIYMTSRPIRPRSIDFVESLNFINIDIFPVKNDADQVKQKIIEFSKKNINNPIERDEIEKSPSIQFSQLKNIQEISDQIKNAISQRNMLIFEQVISNLLKNTFLIEDEYRMYEVITIFDKAIEDYGRQSEILDPSTIEYAMGKEILTLGFLSYSFFPNTMNPAWIEMISIKNQDNRSRYMALPLNNFFLKGGEFNKHVLKIFKDYLNISFRYSNTSLNNNNINLWLNYTDKKIGDTSVNGTIIEAETKVNNVAIILKFQYDDMFAVYEAFVHEELNVMRNYIPNIPLLYGIQACKMDIDPQSPTGYKELCPVSPDPSANVTNILLMEKIDGITLRRYISHPDANANILLSTIQQVLCSLEIMQKKLEFSHNDLHIGNVMLTYLEKNPELYNKHVIFKYIVEENNTQAILMYFLASIIDFGYSSTKNSRFRIKHKISDSLRDDYGIDLQKFNPMCDVWVFLVDVYLSLIIYHPEFLYPNHSIGQPIKPSSSFLAYCFDMFFIAFRDMFVNNSLNSLYDFISKFLDEPDSNVRMNSFTELIEGFNTTIDAKYRSKHLGNIYKLPSNFADIHPAWYKGRGFTMNTPAKVAMLFSQDVYANSDSIIYRWALSGKTGREYNKSENKKIRRNEDNHRKLMNVASSLANITNGRLICEIEDEKINVTDMKECYDMIYHRK